MIHKDDGPLDHNPGIEDEPDPNEPDDYDGGEPDTEPEIDVASDIDIQDIGNGESEATENTEDTDETDRSTDEETEGGDNGSE
jgi:hypothetical protein